MVPEPAGDVDARYAAALAAARGRVSVLTDTRGAILRVSPSVRDLLGYTPDELVGMPIYQLYADPAHAEYSRHYFLYGRDDLTATIVDVGMLSRTARVRAKDERQVVVDSFPSPMRNVPSVRGVLVEWVPVSDRRFLTEAVDALALGLPPVESVPLITRLVESLFAQAEVGVVATTAQGWTAVACPPGRACAQLTEALPDPSDPQWSKPWFALEAWLPPLRDDPRDRRDRTASVGSYLIREAEAAVREQLLQLAAVPLRATENGPLLGALVIARHVVQPVSVFAAPAANLLQVAQRMATLALASERTQSELRAAAEHDPLTGLSNRAGMVRRIGELAEGGTTEVTLVFVDLDDFKLVNDGHGHQAGDRMLIEVAGRISAAVRATDLVCRYGGDEFVVLITGRLGSASRRRVQDALRSAMERPVMLPDGAVVPARASVGVSTGELRSIPDLLRACDERLYEDKRRRKAGL